jgi:hypothetical protein
LFDFHVGKMADVGGALVEFVVKVGLVVSGLSGAVFFRVVREQAVASHFCLVAKAEDVVGCASLGARSQELGGGGDSIGVGGLFGEVEDGARNVEDEVWFESLEYDLGTGVENFLCACGRLGGLGGFA